MAYIVSPRFWAFLVAGVWALIWAFGAAAFVFSHNYNALWILGIFSTPSSLVVSGLSHALGMSLRLLQGRDHSLICVVSYFSALRNLLQSVTFSVWESVGSLHGERLCHES